MIRSGSPVSGAAQASLRVPAPEIGIELEAWTDGGNYLNQFGIVDRRV